MFPCKVTLTAAILAFQTTIAVPIINGDNALLGEFPQAVGFAPGCGGAIINANTVLTAAHCIIQTINYYKGTDLSRSQVIAGALSPRDVQTATISAISSFHVHPEYNKTGNHEHDLGILKLSTDIAENKEGTIRYAKLPQGLSDPKPGSDITVVGWGAISANGPNAAQLQKIVIPVVDRGECSSQFGRAVDISIFCAGDKNGGKDSCGSDSGSPVFWNGIVIGLVAYGAKDCGTLSGAYTRLDIDLDFIRQHASSSVSARSPLVS